MSDVNEHALGMTQDHLQQGWRRMYMPEGYGGIQRVNRYAYFATVAHFELPSGDTFASTPPVFLSGNVAVQVSGSVNLTGNFTVFRSTIDPDKGFPNWTNVTNDYENNAYVRGGLGTLFHFDEPAAAWFTVVSDGDRGSPAIVSISGGGA